jgi:lipopolysaccharide/colanic/teichoic acid biosynthesis glycosyltransferase/SAM-dependent methyltransferase
MFKRLFDLFVAVAGLIAASPILIPTMVAIWLQDFHSPFYIAPRVGRNEVLFRMVKLRSMVIRADKTGVDSTAANDPRITRVGHFIRRYKLDELAQLWNVVKGDMSLVGPRPNVKRETDLYTRQEKRLLSVRPGITDMASIVFSDENDILKDSQDPDLDYNQLIRPWKSRLGLLYVDNRSLWLDVKLIYLTAVAITSREKALAGVQEILRGLGADPELCCVARREAKLTPYPPPGAIEIVTNRNAPPLQIDEPGSATHDFSELTEQPGTGATAEQIERLYQRYDFARRYAEGKRVLEVACGAGFGLGYLHDVAKTVVGADYTGNLLQVAKGYYGDRAPLSQLDAHDLPFADQSFDLIFIYEALYYLHDQDRFVCEARRLLDQDGILIIGTVNSDWGEWAPSPFSTEYPAVVGLRSLLERNQFTDVHMFAAFPTESHGLKHQIIALVRRLVINLDLMPDTLEGRARFKRLVYGNLKPLPSEVRANMAALEPVVEIPSDRPTGAYKILFAVGRAN